MLVFPTSKINLGLHITEKRTDGFHNIETVLYNTSWKDALEVVEGGQDFDLEVSGLSINGALKQENIVYKAYKLLLDRHKLPPIMVYLHKNVPMGAGLGGGSADAAFFIKALNEKFALKMSNHEVKELVSQLGSDCAFFIGNTPVLATQKGDVFEPVKLDLNQYFIIVVYPGINSNTKEAYAGVVPQKPKISLREIMNNEPIENWKNVLVNDFEGPIFNKYPEVKNIKSLLYSKGAVYASMSGSGSAVYGIFKEKPFLELPNNYLWHLQKPIKYR